VRHELADAIRTVHRGGQALPAAVAHRLATYTASVALTPRELEVLRLLAKGMRNRDIAETIGRTETTVKVHLLHVFQKLQVEDRTEAVVVARRRGIVHLD
jgi:DNA-binding NarL/FixJ family response regulator